MVFIIFRRSRPLRLSPAGTSFNHTLEPGRRRPVFEPRGEGTPTPCRTRPCGYGIAQMAMADELRRLAMKSDSGGESAQALTARNLLSRPPRRKRSDRRSALRSEGVCSHPRHKRMQRRHGLPHPACDHRRRIVHNVDPHDARLALRVWRFRGAELRTEQ